MLTHRLIVVAVRMHKATTHSGLWLNTKSILLEGKWETVWLYVVSWISLMVSGPGCRNLIRRPIMVRVASSKPSTHSDDVAWIVFSIQPRKNKLTCVCGVCWHWCCCLSVSVLCPTCHYLARGHTGLREFKHTSNDNLNLVVSCYLTEGDLFPPALLESIKKTIVIVFIVLCLVDKEILKSSTKWGQDRLFHTATVMFIRPSWQISSSGMNVLMFALTEQQNIMKQIV